MEISEVNDMKLKLEALIESELNKFHRITGLEINLSVRDFDLSKIGDALTKKHYEVKLRIAL